ncbi:MAG TPA: ABC transporter substrate-binding protein [Candidatus Dormibacteraeota bacterium]|nr:ABC transporter substrate-binding protein [Candidatus Dormibacteraeota bacterium]
MAQHRVVHLGMAGAVSVSLLATACGSSGSSSSSSSSSGNGAAQCVAQGVTPTSISIGDLYAESGPSAPTRAGWGDGVDARFDLQNAGGGVANRQIQVTHEDDQGTATANLDRTRDLVENKQVFMITNDAVAVGNADYLQNAGIPSVGLPQEDPTGTYQNFYATTGQSALPGHGSSAQADFLKSLGVTTVAVFTHNIASSIASGEVFAKASEADGLKVAYKRENVPVVPGDFTADVAQLKANGVDGGYVGMVVPVEVALYKAAVEAGVNYKGFIFANLYDPNVVKQVGSVVEGAYSQVSHAPFEENLPETQKFEAAMKKYAPNASIGTNAFQGWLTADFVIQVLQKLGACPTRSAFISTMKTMTWDGNGTLPQKIVYHQPPLCYYVVKITGGAFQPANNGKPICGHAVS